MPTRAARIALTAALGFASPASAQDRPKPMPAPSTAPAANTPSATPVPENNPLKTLEHEAAALRPLVSSDLARAFLDETPHLPPPPTRTILRNKDRSAAYTPEQAAKLPPAARVELTDKTYAPTFFYNTGYGTPLVYARVVDLLAKNGVSTLAGKKLLDFGYGTIGHIRLLAALGCDAHGVDVEPVFQALYSQRGDQGEVRRFGGGAPGRVTLHTGRWPAEPALAAEIGTGYDIITSKNTLKRGYIHPAREADPRTLVHLGVDDDAFLHAVHEALNPGGLFIIYNICPAQAPPDKPYIPWADGQCPFPRELLEKTGFQVIQFDHEDRDLALDYWMALELNQGKSREDTRADLFAWYTICRKPAAPATLPTTTDPHK